MGMILEYDQSPNATVDQKVGTLKDSVQRALEDVEQNTEGKPGADGASVEKIVEQWCLSTSRYSPVGTWEYTQPEWKPEHYLWTRNEVHWTNGRVAHTDPGIADALNKAYQAAYEAGGVLDDIEVRVSTAEQKVLEIEKLSSETDALAKQAKASADTASAKATQVEAELTEADRQIGVLTQELETLEQNMSANYATKGELTGVETTLESKISQNAVSISSTVTRVDQIDIDVSAAQEAADAAQSAADQAAEKAADAQTKYTALKNQADTTDEELEAAKTALEKAQADATAAGDAAAAAKSLADSLESRTTTNETAIKQNSDSISLVAETASAAVSSLESAKSEWEVNFESISGRVESTEKWQDDKNELITEMQKVTELLIENGKFKFNFNQMLTDVEENKEELQKQTKYVQIVEDASEGATIIIGDSESGMVAQFTKTALTFKNGDTVLATYANDGLTVENITTKNQLLFEGHGWAIRPGKEVTSGKFNLNDVWIGG